MKWTEKYGIYTLNVCRIFTLQIWWKKDGYVAKIGDFQPLGKFKTPSKAREEARKFAIDKLKEGLKFLED